MTDISRSPGAGRKSPVIIILKYVLIAIVVYFVGRKLVANWQEVVAYRWSINPYLLALSVAAHILTFVLLAQVWCFIISGFGFRVPLGQAFKISYIANLGRYIPGKIWQMFGMVLLARKIDISEEVAVASWALAQVYAIPAAFLACAVSLVFHPQMYTDYISSLVGTAMYVVAAVIFVISVLVIVVPDKALLLFNVLLRIFKRPQVTFRLSKLTALKVYLGYFVCWLLFGFSFWLFLNAVIEDPQIPIMAGIVTFLLAYQVGYLTVFSPGGLGVRELVLTSLLTPFVGPVAAGVAVASRLWNMIAEIIAALIALKIKLPESNH
ncbi:MAG: flippase-like domain-containing protein [Candidatus Zixiibacteriota bacterium]|nr:MAG: flippase-like domain-containing protein [candidate division Zixibacteria bacterium]